LNGSSGIDSSKQIKSATIFHTGMISIKQKAQRLNSDLRKKRDQNVALIGQNSNRLPHDFKHKPPLGVMRLEEIAYQHDNFDF
jgi:hypothetical protein